MREEERGREREREIESAVKRERVGNTESGRESERGRKREIERWKRERER